MDWVVAALPLLREHARREGKEFVCVDCAQVSGSAVTEATYILELSVNYR